MKILVVEDTLAEQERARQALEAQGLDYVVVDNVVEAAQALALGVDGVITDLEFFPLAGKRGGDLRHYYGLMPPSGLMVAMSAVTMGVPVVICTDTYHNPDTHIAVRWIRDCDEAIKAIISAKAKQLGLSEDDPTVVALCPYGSLDCPEYAKYNLTVQSPLSPFGWEGEKDWDNAVRAILLRIEGKPSLPSDHLSAR